MGFVLYNTQDLTSARSHYRTIMLQGGEQESNEAITVQDVREGLRSHC